MSNPNHGPPLGERLVPFNLLATAPVLTTQPVTFNLVDGQMILVVQPAGPLVVQPAGAQVAPPAGAQFAPYPLSRHHATGTTPPT